MFAEQPVSGQSPGAQPNAPTAEETLRVRPPEPVSVAGGDRSCPICGAVYAAGSTVCPTCSDSSGSGAGGRSWSVPTSIPLALGASVAFTIAGAVVWCILAGLVGVGWVSFMALVVCALAGYGLQLFSGRCGAGLGVLAIFIGMCGLFFGKVLIAKWVVMPKLMPAFREGIDSAFDEMDSEQLSAADVNEMLDDPNMMFILTLMRLMDDGEFDRDVVIKIVMARQLQSDMPPPELAEQIERAEKRVNECLESWSPEEKEQVVREQLPKFIRGMADVLMDSKIGAAIGFIAALIAVMSCQDLIWFPMGLICAYRVGSGND
jgi:hypothetical protein